ncbi:hypothetical protein [Chryseobacterium proteolyticum]|uniref:hypothetical protein n=1 Tax=Chryseobacterium proteolyticum TaxID=118127 RepID=UPI003982D941
MKNLSKSEIVDTNLIKNNIMNVKRIFGTILTLLGIGGLIYVGNGLITKGVANMPIIVVGIIGLLFFFAGISLVKNTKDES